MVKTAIALGILLVATVPAWAEHRTLQPPEATQPADDKSLQFDLKIGRDGFRLGSRLFGRDGVSGAWLNGRLLPYGLSLDGRVQSDGHSRDFKLNLDLEDLLPHWLRL